MSPISASSQPLQSGTPPEAVNIAIVGYGEVGTIFGAALAKAGAASVHAYDILASQPAWFDEALSRAQRDGVTLVDDARRAVSGASLVISSVTAASTTAAAANLAGLCDRGTFVLDVNSASPRTKAACAELVESAGGCYVEAAMMTSVPPYGLRVPMLIGGPHADALLPVLERLGFAASVGSRDYGVVSAIKLCRSIFIKGLEALAVEGLLAARRHGVEREVIASLAETFPGIEWPTQLSYFWRRVVQHGRRRAEEMREAAAMVSDGGEASRMAAATADVQAWIAALRADGRFADTPADAPWEAFADRIATADHGAKPKS